MSCFRTYLKNIHIMWKWETHYTVYRNSLFISVFTIRFKEITYYFQTDFLYPLLSDIIQVRRRPLCWPYSSGATMRLLTTFRNSPMVGGLPLTFTTWDMQVWSDSEGCELGAFQGFIRAQTTSKGTMRSHLILGSQSEVFIMCETLRSFG